MFTEQITLIRELFKQKRITRAEAIAWHSLLVEIQKRIKEDIYLW